MQIVSGGYVAAKLKKKLRRIRSGSKVWRDSSSGSLGSDWLQRTSSSSWEHFSDDYSQESDGGEEQHLPKDVPEGFLAVYVGEEKKRFVVDARHLNHKWFKVLLERSAEEYGFDHKGGLALPCTVCVFESLLRALHGELSSKDCAKIEELLKL